MSEEQQAGQAVEHQAGVEGAAVQVEPGSTGPGSAGREHTEPEHTAPGGAAPSHREDFGAHVRRLVAEGRLSPEDAGQLLGGGNTQAGAARADTTPQEARAERPLSAAQGGPRLLQLDVSGYTLSVVHDPALSAPTLSAHPEGHLELRLSGDRWSLRPHGQRFHGLRAVLSVPFFPPEVQAGVRGGSLTLPDGEYALRAEVQGGSLRAGGLGALRAEVAGGSVATGMVEGELQVEVAGGSVRTGGRTLRASVSGGSLDWSGDLNSGQHRLEVNGGSATLRLSAASSVQVSAEVTVGGFRADFPLEQGGSMFHKRYRGQLGAGDAELRCEVNAGQVRLEGVTLP